MYNIAYLRCDMDGTFDLFNGIRIFASSASARISAKQYNNEVDAQYMAMQVVSEDGHVVFDDLADVCYVTDPMGDAHIRMAGW